MNIRSLILLAVTASDEKSPGPVLRTEGHGQEALADYKLDASDRIKNSVSDEPTLSGARAVGADRLVSLPLFGELPPKGHAIDEVVSDACMLFADACLPEPRLRCKVNVFSPFFVSTEAIAHGGSSSSAGVPKMNAIARSVTPRTRRVAILNGQKDEPDEVNQRITPGLLVYPRDTVSVRERFL
jgi:hypothetical protein